jgi:hypothetical protein
MIRPRKKLRRGELTSKQKESERDRVYDRCGGTCELQLMPECWENSRLSPFRKIGFTPWDHWHLVHLHAKRSAFWSEQQGNTLLGGCPVCHLEGMHRLGLKPDMESIMARREAYAHQNT